MLKVAINGFGRIGKMALRSIIERNMPIKVVAINDLSGPENAALLFEHDSTYGKFPGTVDFDENHLIINGDKTLITGDRDPSNLPWKELEVDVVLECTGVFRDKEGCQKHLDAGAKKVIISAPGKDVDSTIVMGVNEGDLKKEDTVISCASCTTNCLAPVAKILNDEFGIVNGIMNTIHAYTGDQNLLDGKHKDLRRARSACESIVPTKTGAAAAVKLVVPELDGKIDGFALRVPTPTVSAVDLTFQTEKEVTVEMINSAVARASEGDMKGIMGIETKPLVSIDFRKDDRSSILDAQLTRVMGTNFAKIVTWYDNEWGYANRLVELALLAGNKN